MDKQTFAIGDVVKLKSGGHDMTVQGFKKANGDVVTSDETGARIEAVWLDESGKMHTSHGLVPAMLESVKSSRSDQPPVDNDHVEDGCEPFDQSHESWLKDRETPGMGNAENNSPSQLGRPMSPKVQSMDQKSVHTGDDLPQSLGHEAERQPAQEAEIAHARITNDPQDDAGTIHERTDKTEKASPGAR